MRLERGYYGEFGGAYLPEILVATFDELETAFAAAQADPAFWREYETLMGEYSCRPTPLTFAENLTRALRRRAHLRQARGPEPHRRAQGQQRDGPGAAGPAHGQAARDRRDRRRPARRGHRDHGGQVRLRVHHLHGRGRRRAAAAQRLLDGAAGRARWCR